MRLTQEHSDHVLVGVLKSTYTPQSSVLLSSSASSSHMMESSPDAQSISPRSPPTSRNSQPWPNLSPTDSAANRASLSLKSSGSQTDSLDSPQPSGRTSRQDTDKGATSSNGDDMCYPVMAAASKTGHHGHNQHAPQTVPSPPQQLPQDHEPRRNMFEKAMQMIQKPFHHSSEAHRERNGRHERSDRDARCRSGVPYLSPSPREAAEDEALGELDAMINAYDSNSQNLHAHSAVGKQKPRRKRERDPRENSGTWPKTRSPMDSTSLVGFHPVGRRKERTPLGNIVNNSVPDSVSPYRGGDNNVAPSPPERNDSFNRSASIKHSPQSSDSTVIFFHKPSPEPSSSVNLSAAYTSSSPSATQSSHSNISSQSKSKKGGSGDPHAEASTMPRRASYDQPSHYLTSVKSDPRHQTPSTTQSGEYNVRMNSETDASKFVPPTSTSRGAPHTSAHTRQPKDHEPHSQLRHSHGREPLSGPIPKPMSLDVNPMYSPRPLPHSGHNITVVPHSGAPHPPLPNQHAHLTVLRSVNPAQHQQQSDKALPASSAQPHQPVFSTQSPGGSGILPPRDKNLVSPSGTQTKPPQSTPVR